jgi:hypothetical protein
MRTVTLKTDRSFFDAAFGFGRLRIEPYGEKEWSVSVYTNPGFELICVCTAGRVAGEVAERIRRAIEDAVLCDRTNHRGKGRPLREDGRRKNGKESKPEGGQDGNGSNAEDAEDHG